MVTARQISEAEARLEQHPWRGANLSPAGITYIDDDAGFPKPRSPSTVLDEPSVKRLLSDREQTHGKFADVSRTTLALRSALYTGNERAALAAGQLIALDMIVMKMARIVCGDPDYPDHWDDIAGYAVLGKTHGPVDP